MGIHPDGEEIQKMKGHDWLSVTLLIIIFAFSLHFYGLMPERMAIHWGVDGNANGYGSRFIGLFPLPILALVVWVLLRFLPMLDPFKKNIEKFKPTYHTFIVVVLAFLLLIHISTIGYNLGQRFNLNLVILPAMGVLFFYTGVLIGKAKRNYFIGIRTPWTLASDKVWDRTHALGGKLFKLSGLISIVCAFFPFGIYALLTSAIASSALSIVYSYVLFSRIKKI
jgi:uncharacterized membrane protein